MKQREKGDICTPYKAFSHLAVIFHIEENIVLLDSFIRSLMRFIWYLSWTLPFGTQTLQGEGVKHVHKELCHQAGCH